MKKFISKIGEKFNGNDFLFFGGLILLGVGIGLVSIPASLATVGGVALLVGLWGAHRAG